LGEKEKSKMRWVREEGGDGRKYLLVRYPTSTLWHNIIYVNWGGGHVNFVNVLLINK
jgi:hypothetical protein